MDNVLKEYNETKKKIKNPESAAECIKYGTSTKEYFFKDKFSFKSLFSNLYIINLHINMLKNYQLLNGPVA